jgi:hypothetical protein
MMRLTQSALVRKPQWLFWPAAARKEPSFSFDFAATPQNQTNLNSSFALPAAAARKAPSFVLVVAAKLPQPEQ